MKSTETATVSPKYQVVIPKSVRERFGIRPGQKMRVLCVGGSLRLVPVRPLKELRGFAKGIPAFEREADREL